MIKTQKNDKQQRIINNLNQNSILTIKAANINWFRIRQPRDFIELSVNTLLPNMGATDITNFSKDKLFALKLQNELKLLTKKFNHSKIIAPEYYFSRSMVKRLEKLRDIFLEFDKDFSRKLEINELFDMFKTNNIPVEMEDLITLFFKNQKLKKGEEPCLNFFQLIEFAFNQDNERMFEVFIRKVKKTYLHQNKHNSLGVTRLNSMSSLSNYTGRQIIPKRNNLSNIIEVSNEEIYNTDKSSYTNENLNNKKIEKSKERRKSVFDNNQSLYLPMSINLLLDYLNKRSTIRTDYDEINKSLYFIESFNDENEDFMETQTNPVERDLKNHEDIKIESVNDRFIDILTQFNKYKEIIETDEDDEEDEVDAKKVNKNMKRHDNISGLIYESNIKPLGNHYEIKEINEKEDKMSTINTIDSKLPVKNNRMIRINLTNNCDIDSITDSNSVEDYLKTKSMSSNNYIKIDINRELNLNRNENNRQTIINKRTEMLNLINNECKTIKKIIKDDNLSFNNKPSSKSYMNNKRFNYTMKEDGFKLPFLFKK